MAITSAAELVAELERRIAEGDLRPGDRLAPVRQTAESLGVAANTVAAAYRRLGERGLVYGDGRRGTFVAERPAVCSPRFEPVPTGSVDLAHGNPDPDLLPDLATGARAALAQARRPVLYGDPTANEDFVQAITPHLANDLGALVEGGLLVAGRNLAVVGGALDGVERTLGAQLRPGDVVAVEDPGYHAIFDLLRAMGLRPEPVAIDDEGMQPDRLGEALKRGVNALAVTPRAQNPTGAAVTERRADELRQVLLSYPEVLVIEDDHAGAVAGCPYHRVIPDGHQHWVVIRSMAKALGPDMRVAALVGDETTVARVVGRQSLGVGWVSHVLQATAAQMLSDAAVIALLDRAADAYAVRRSVVVDGLAAAGLAVSARSGLNVWIPVDDEAEVVAAMRQRGYVLRSGSRFRLRTGPAVRLSVAGQPVTVLAQAAEALPEVLAGGTSSRSA